MSSLQKNTGLLGYAWLRDRLRLPSFLGARAAHLAATHSMLATPSGALMVPARMAPPDTLLGHLLFALKYEGVNLYLLAAGLKQVPAADMEAAHAATPNGVYVRTACHLWELVTGENLSQGDAVITAPYQAVFDPQRYCVGASRRSAKWRMDFNGLGEIGFCPTVRRTPALQRLLEQDILAQARQFAQNIGIEVLDRALGWAYLSETEGSFAIEGEVPSQDKAQAFVNLLKHAGDARELTEGLLCELQRLSITNEFDQAFEFRSEQNRLQKGVGAAGVRYVPPKPERVPALMDGLMDLANRKPQELDPLVHAAIVSFGFVFIHPFMDGNGRLSRFLIHHCLGQSGALPRAVVLPVSVAMKRHEDEYLQALVDFSAPARELCEVLWAGDEDYFFTWKPHADEAFRFMDLTAAAEFTLSMAQVALEQDLLRQAQWLGDFDAIYKQIKHDHDVRDADLSTLIAIALQNGGAISRGKRKTYADRVPVRVFEAIDALCTARLAIRRGELAG